MNPFPSTNGASPENTLDVTDDSLQAIDIEQWQMEIDNFIDEASMELGQLANLLDGGPINETAQREVSSHSPIDRKPSRTNPPSENRASLDRPAQSQLADSGDRLESLKQKLASRIKKQEAESTTNVSSNHETGK